MTKVPQGFDCSFLNDEEARKILQVLERNEELQRAEKERISKLQKTKRDIRWLQGVTGEWFEEIQRKKFCNETDVSQMLKQPLTHRLRKGMEENDPVELQTSRSKNIFSQRNPTSIPSRLSFRSSFASLFSFRKSRKETSKLQSLGQTGCDGHTPSVSVRGTALQAKIYSSPLESQPTDSATVPKPASMREGSTVPPWDGSLLEDEFFQGQTLFRVVIKSLSPKELVRIHVPKPLDRNDGTFLMRYRMYETVSKGLKIEVLYGDEHVAQSPYILKGPVYHEYCECPEEDPQAWQKTLSCPDKEPQIEKDFASFPSINLQQMLIEVPKRFGDERGAIVHYTILNNNIYRRSLGKYTDFKMFSDEILLSLARKVLLPDLEFYVNLGDWPLEHRKVNETPGPLPIISWCGSLDSQDVILPTYDITHSTLEALRGVTNDLLSIQGNTGPSWINKTEKAFFRGRDSREERLQLVQLSKENPQLLDAGITGYFFFQEKEKELGKAKLIGFFDFFKYKYQVNVDGTVAAYRYPYLMLGDSLVLKQDSPYYEHFYMALKPWKHYIPIKRNLSDLLEKVEWAKENDEEAKKIAKEGQLTARDLLQPHRLYCYYYTVLQKYAERQLSKPEVRDGMELVPQPDDSASLCQCHRRRPLRQEL
ncbi:protein O-glucosyltransferase 3 isoform X1 [Bos mutus]|uniref:protein O-glucosyltransferase 3 isoform X1 n=2 Tax=Bos mutus TaxID=72004 RepID=UPI0038B60D43